MDYNTQHQILNISDEHIGKEMSGEEFNKLFHGTKFVKLTNKLEDHNGFEFGTGLNSDRKRFSVLEPLRNEELFFTTAEKAHLFFTYRYSVCKYARAFSYSPMKYTRDVTIPNDTCIYIEKDKFIPNKIILGPKSDIDQDTIKRAVIHRGLNLEHVDMEKPLTDSKLLELCRLAVQQDGLALQYVLPQFKTNDICILAVKQNGDALYHVNNHKRVGRNDYALHYANKQTEEICVIAVKQNSGAIQFVNEQYREACLDTFELVDLKKYFNYF